VTEASLAGGFGRLAQHSPRRYFLIIFLLGSLLRISLFTAHKDYLWIEHSEMMQIGSSLAWHGTFADPYSKPTGPTAHALPLFPLFIALVLRLAGNPELSQYILQVVASLASSLQYALLPLIAASLGWPVALGAIAGLVGALVPIHFWVETKGSWESAFTGLALALIVWQWIPCLKQGISVGKAWATGLGWGVALLLSASLLPVLVSLALLLLFRNRDFGRFFPTALTLGCGILLVMMPWFIRNAMVFRAFVPFRSIFGLEISLSNSDGAKPTFAEMEQTGEVERVHPFLSKIEQEKVRALGEIRYNSERTQAARQWIETHPRRFLWLTVRRGLFFWFPTMKRWPQTALGYVIRALTIVSFVVLIRKDAFAALLFGCIWTSYSLIYYLAAADVRYSYPLWWSFLLVASYLFRPLFRDLNAHHNQSELTT